MNGPSTSAPAPSTHIFVHELRRQRTGSKVRFLCYLREYDAAKGQLLVEHAYPHDATEPARASIDVNMVLETARRDLMTDGRWLNVIGYVLSGPQEKKRKSTNAGNAQSTSKEVPLPIVQAVLLWDAGAINVDEYERVLQKHMEVRAQARVMLDNACKAEARKEQEKKAKIPKP